MQIEMVLLPEFVGILMPPPFRKQSMQQIKMALDLIQRNHAGRA
jgi:hypothetical protein